MRSRALVVGGAGAMGRWCAGFLKQAGLDVSIASRGDASEAAAALGVEQAPADAAGDFDIVVLSVPPDAVEGAAARVGPLLRPGAVLADLSSLKKGPMASMGRHAAPGAEVVGIHPLFGPDVPDVAGRNVVLVPSDRSGRWLPVLAGLFEGAGAAVVVATAEEHDAKMAVVQGLTHFMYVAWGEALERLGVGVDELRPFQTPVFGVTCEMAGRVLSQSPELYALIQAGEYVGPVRAAFLGAGGDLAKMADCGDLQGFIAAFQSAARHYGDTAGARARSERLLQLARETAPAIGALRRGLLVKMPVGADASVLRWVLGKIDGVTGVESEISDALNPDYVVYRFTIDVSPGRSDETLQRVLGTIWGLGLEVK